jgi:hypothetical protein
VDERCISRHPTCAAAPGLSNFRRTSRCIRANSSEHEQSDRFMNCSRQLNLPEGPSTQGSTESSPTPLATPRIQPAVALVSRSGDCVCVSSGWYNAPRSSSSMPLILISPAKTMTFALERSAPVGVMATRPAYQRTAAALASRLAQVRHVKIMRSLNSIASRFVQTRVLNAAAAHTTNL